MSFRYATVVLAAASLTTIAAVVVAVGSDEADAVLTTVETCDGGAIDLTNNEKQTLDLHNQARVNEGLSPFCVHPALAEAARAHSQEMLDKGYFSHRAVGDETLEARLERFGYTFSGYSYWAYAENIGQGAGSLGTPNGIFEYWMTSNEHSVNIFNEDFQEVGVGVRDTGSEGGTAMYTVDFGVRY
jgi:uncharacterized protein YkwD